MDADEDHAMEVTGSETEDRLVSEFQSWKILNPNHVLNLGLERIEKDTDGTASLRLHLRFAVSCVVCRSDVISVYIKFLVSGLTARPSPCAVRPPTLTTTPSRTISLWKRPPVFSSGATLSMSSSWTLKTSSVCLISSLRAAASTAARTGQR